MEADTLSKIITESGPLAGMIVLLGVLIKTWFQDSKRAIDKIGVQIEGIHKDLSKKDTAIQLLEKRVESVEKDVEKIERRLEDHSRPINVSS